MAGLCPPLLVALLFRNKFVEEDGLQELTVVLMIVEQTKDEIYVLVLVLPANVRIYYAALQDRARLGVNGLELSGVTVSSRGGGGGCGEDVHLCKPTRGDITLYPYPFFQGPYQLAVWINR